MLIKTITGINTRIIMIIIIKKILSVLKILSFVISKLCFKDSKGLEPSSTIKQTQNIDFNDKKAIISNSKISNISEIPKLRSNNKSINKNIAIIIPYSSAITTKLKVILSDGSISRKLNS